MASSNSLGKAESRKLETDSSHKSQLSLVHSVPTHCRSSTLEEFDWVSLKSAAFLEKCWLPTCLRWFGKCISISRRGPLSVIAVDKIKSKREENKRCLGPCVPASYSVFFSQLLNFSIHEFSCCTEQDDFWPNHTVSPGTWLPRQIKMLVPCLPTDLAMQQGCVLFYGADQTLYGSGKYSKISQSVTTVFQFFTPSLSHEL